MPLFPLGLDDLELGLGFDDLDLVAVCLPVGCDFLLELGGLNNSSSLSSEILIWSSSSDSDLKNKIRALTCDFQQCGILTSVDSDRPVQPPFKLRNSKWRSVSSLTVIEYSSD